MSKKINKLKAMLGSLSKKEVDYSAFDKGIQELKKNLEEDL